MDEIELIAGQICVLSDKLKIFTREKHWPKAAEQVAYIREELNKWEAALRKIRKSK